MQNLTKTKTVLKTTLLVVFSIFLVGCTNSNPSTDLSGSDTTITDKNQEITLSGTLSKSGTTYLLTTPSGVVQDLESYTVDFDANIGSTVTVVGEYSGDTLFVTELR